VFICETTAATGACLSPPAASVQFQAAPNAPHTFAVFVQRPAVDPGFDPGQRRVLVTFEQLSPPGFFGANPIPILVGSTGVAVRARRTHGRRTPSREIRWPFRYQPAENRLLARCWSGQAGGEVDLRRHTLRLDPAIPDVVPLLLERLFLDLRTLPLEGLRVRR